ncbi:flippase [Candidatus Parcubacteria bacterium]|nr:flippase [Patescibacteria group bacterium]MBU4309148.1 flippase [Patescibacteria group bacterium]MBU4432159.1 flippase [Patescibacteria group bacterium]MBU4577509.1 flippase [Patescibacteria group bacterium]MCG2697196.1 flippase [Candidatus Parcubacteria bacterium]
MKINNIAKNTSYYTMALVMQKVVSFAYFAMLARTLSPEDLGRYYFAISFTSIFGIFIDIGLFNFLTREVAKNNDQAPTQENGGKKAFAQNLLSTVMAIKIPTAIFSALLVAMLASIFHYSPVIKFLIYLSSISMVLDSFAITFYAVMRGFHNLKFESVGVFIFQVIVFVFGYFSLRAGLGLNWLIIALALASLFGFTYSALTLYFRFGINIRPRWNKTLMWSMMVTSSSFAIFGILQRMYTYVDQVLLQWLAGEKYVGLYQVPFKIIFALQFLPMAFTASLYPAFSSYWRNNREQLPISFSRAVNYLLIISMPISGGVMILAYDIVKIFKTEYVEAVVPLQIIIASVVFIFLNFPIGSLLNACDKQKINTRNMAIGLAVSVIMNLILIPQYQAIGAGITILATNFLMFVLGMAQVVKIIDYKYKNNVLTFFKILASVVVMVSVAFALKQYLNIFVNVAISGVVYLTTLFAMRGFTKADVFSIAQSFSRK